MKCLACFLEELSAKEMLKGVLPRILPEDIDVRYIVFEGKQDLDKRIEHRLRGWNRPDSFFLVLRDQDNGDCVKIKQFLRKKIQSSGKFSNTIIRVACKELESFYLGDLKAVESGLGVKGLSLKEAPDSINKPSEKLKGLTEQSYQKVAGSRAIAPLLNLDGQNDSHSFNVLLDGVKSIMNV